MSDNTVGRPTKEDLAVGIAQRLGLVTPYVSDGSSVESKFLDAVHLALNGRTNPGRDTYRKTEAILDDLGLTYDPFWDTSESAGSGGGTVTNRAYSRILSAISDTPRCFILNTTDSKSGARWSDYRGDVYRYDNEVRGRRALNDAGPGSLVLFYSTGRSSSFPKHFVSTASVSYIAPGWTGPWEATLDELRDLTRPIPATEVHLEGWNRQNAITEISYETYLKIASIGDDAVALPSVLGLTGRSPGLDRTAEFATALVLAAFPPHPGTPRVIVPDALPQGVIVASEPLAPAYGDAQGPSPLTSAGKRTSKGYRDLNKVAERRAIELVTADLQSQGWDLLADRQTHGTGYDLEFARLERRLNVEVKGIQGSNQVFNLTPKELWRAETDHDWVLATVTSVLSPTAYSVSMFTRDRVLGADRRISGFRVTL